MRHEVGSGGAAETSGGCGGGYTLLDMESAPWIMNTLFSTNFCTNNHASPHLFILGMPS